MSLVEDIQRMLEKAKRDYQSAAAMHAMSRVPALGARIETLEEVLELITGSRTGSPR